LTGWIEKKKQTKHPYHKQHKPILFL